MIVIGLTGPIGCGKSTVAGWLGDLGAHVIDADGVARNVTPPGSPELAAVVEAFGRDVLHADGSLDRAALGRIVFADPAALRRLEAIVHPLVAQQQRMFVKRAALRGEPVVVLDIPLLFEGMGERRVDGVLVVSAPAFLQRQRVMARPGMTAEKFAGILRQQVPDPVKRRKATVVIPTGLGLAPTRRALAQAVRALMKQQGRAWPANPHRDRFTAQLARAKRR